MNPIKNIFNLDYDPTTNIAVLIFAIIFYVVIFYLLGLIFQNRYKLLRANRYLALPIGFVVYMLVTAIFYFFPTLIIVIFNLSGGHIFLTWIEFIKNIIIIIFIIFGFRTIYENAWLSSYYWKALPYSFFMLSIGFIIYICLSGTMFGRGYYYGLDYDSSIYFSYINQMISDNTLIPTVEIYNIGTVIIDKPEFGLVDYSYNINQLNVFSTNSQWVATTVNIWNLDVRFFTNWFYAIITYWILFASILLFTKTFCNQNYYLELLFTIVILNFLRFLIYNQPYYSTISIALPLVLLAFTFLGYYFSSLFSGYNLLTFAFMIFIMLVTFNLSTYILLFTFGLAIILMHLIYRQQVTKIINLYFILLIIGWILIFFGNVKLNDSGEIEIGYLNNFKMILLTIVFFLVYIIFYFFINNTKRQETFEKTIYSEVRLLFIGASFLIFILGFLITIINTNNFILGNGFLLYGQSYNFLREEGNTFFLWLKISFIIIIEWLMFFPYFIRRLMGHDTSKIDYRYSLNFILFAIVLNPLSISFFYFLFGDNVSILVVFIFVTFIPTLYKLISELSKPNKIYKIPIRNIIIASLFILISFSLFPIELISTNRSWYFASQKGTPEMEMISINLANSSFSSVDPDYSDPSYDDTYRYIFGDLNHIDESYYYWQNPIDKEISCISSTCNQITVTNTISSETSQYYWDYFYYQQVDYSFFENTNNDLNYSIQNNKGVIIDDPTFYLFKFNNNISEDILTIDNETLYLDTNWEKFTPDELMKIYDFSIPNDKIIYDYNNLFTIFRYKE